MEAFEFVLESKQVGDQREKFVTLMTRGGPEIRKIYKNQAPVEEEVLELKPPRLVIPEYDNAIARLTKYFGSKVNTRMETERFRAMKQEKGEDFSKFLLRLRGQAKRCNFETRTEDEILHQATAGANMEKVREKRIEAAMTLDLLTQFAIGREMLAEQKKKEDDAKKGDGGDWLKSESVLAVREGGYHKRGRDEDRSGGQGWDQPFKKQQFGRYAGGGQDQGGGGSQGSGYRGQNGGGRSNVDCWDCGAIGHRGGDRTCRAIYATCRKCGKRGHFAVKCRSTGGNRGGSRDGRRGI